MVNQKHLHILQQGVKKWNQWRQEHPNVQPDLDGVDLSNVELGEANLSHAALNQAILNQAYLSRADLSYATLKRAILIQADLSEADLCYTTFSEADLSYAIFDQADLSYASFNGTDLSYASLSAAGLSYATFSGANLQMTNFAESTMLRTSMAGVDMSQVKGLETVWHQGPSIIDITTVYRSHGDISEAFLRGAGIPDSFIEYMHSLANIPIDYYSCFISYASQDEAFTKRLYADLQSNRVRCWFAPEDLKIGAKIRPSINESIRLYDKLLLVLSEHSVASQWVEQEVETALAKERKENRIVLYPIRLDRTVMEIEGGWPALIRNTRNIGDFTQWKHHDAYQQAFQRLLRDLKAEHTPKDSSLVFPLVYIVYSNGAHIFICCCSMRGGPYAHTSITEAISNHSADDLRWYVLRSSRCPWQSCHQHHSTGHHPLFAFCLACSWRCGAARN